SASSQPLSYHAFPHGFPPSLFFFFVSFWVSPSVWWCFCIRSLRNLSVLCQIEPLLPDAGSPLQHCRPAKKRKKRGEKKTPLQILGILAHFFFPSFSFSFIS